jgi:hypothetical protein
MKRALRRHHRQRMIQRALYISVLWGIDEADRREWATRFHDNIRACSCWRCGNPRKYYGQVTVQEQRQLHTARAERELV